MVTSTDSTTDINYSDPKTLHNDDIAIDSTSINSTSTPALMTANEPVQQPNNLPSNIPDKVKIHFVAVGSAPILKRTKFQINSDQRFAAVHVFLRKLLKLSPSTDSTNTGSNINGSTNNQNNLFLYCCSAFVPSPDHLIGELRDSFTNVHTKELVIHYSLQEAWG